MEYDSGKHLTLSERAYNEIVRLLVSGSFGADEQIDEQSLADRLSVSRTPVREAIQKLAREGFVEYRPYRGHFVRTYSKQEIDNLYEVRKALEALAIRLAMTRLGDADVARLGQILDAGVAALEGDDLDGYATHDRRFHETVAALSDNATLAQMLGRLSMQIKLCRGVMPDYDPDLAERAAAERTALLDAFRDRDAAAAALLIDAHITFVQDAVRQRLEDAEAEAERAAAAGKRIRSG